MQSGMSEVKALTMGRRPDTGHGVTYDLWGARTLEPAWTTGLRMTEAPSEGEGSTSGQSPQTWRNLC